MRAPRAGARLQDSGGRSDRARRGIAATCVVCQRHRIRLSREAPRAGQAPELALLLQTQALHCYAAHATVAHSKTEAASRWELCSRWVCACEAGQAVPARKLSSRLLVARRLSLLIFRPRPCGACGALSVLRTSGCAGAPALAASRKLRLLPCGAAQATTQPRCSVPLACRSPHPHLLSAAASHQVRSRASAHQQHAEGERHSSDNHQHSPAQSK